MDNGYNDFQHILWLKEVPLKVSLFAWRFLQNRIPVEENLLRRHALSINDQLCTSGRGCKEDRDNLFISCAFYIVIFSI